MYVYIKGLAVARSIHAVRYLECSAKHNRGVRECFDQAARVALPGNVSRKMVTFFFTLDVFLMHFPIHSAYRSWTVRSSNKGFHMQHFVTWTDFQKHDKNITSPHVSRSAWQCRNERPSLSLSISYIYIYS